MFKIYFCSKMCYGISDDDGLNATWYICKYFNLLKVIFTLNVLLFSITITID